MIAVIRKYFLKCYGNYIVVGIKRLKVQLMYQSVEYLQPQKIAAFVGIGDVVVKMHKLSAQLCQAQHGLKAMPPIKGML